MVNGLLTGEIQVGWSGIPNVMALIESGKLRGLLHQRAAALAVDAVDSDLRRARPEGLRRRYGDGACTLPPAPRRKVIARLQAEVAGAMREPAMATRMKQLGMVMEENGTANYVQFMKYDMDRYAQAVKKLNLQIK
jgi:tripartite-type tricarboxylate transporter receptor subunit TctC